MAQLSDEKTDPKALRVYELAKQLNLDSRRLIDLLRRLKVDVRNHMSTLEPEVVQRVSEVVAGTRRESPAIADRPLPRAQHRTPPPPIARSPLPQRPRPPIPSAPGPRPGVAPRPPAPGAQPERPPYAAGPRPPRPPVGAARPQGSGAPPARGGYRNPLEDRSGQRSPAARPSGPGPRPTGSAGGASRAGGPPSARPASGRPDAGRAPGPARPAGTPGARPGPRPGAGPGVPGRPPGGGHPSRRGGRRFDRRYEDREYKTSRPAKRSTTIVAPRTDRPVALEGNLIVQELARKLGLPTGEVIRRLMNLGTMVTLNQEVDLETAEILARDLGYTVEIHAPRRTAEEELVEDEADEPEHLEPRPPVVTVMGHVDHGKTSLLDRIRHTRVTAQEAGGITQHIGAYTVSVHGRKIVFLDTPGHEAFTAIRARGAQVTDLAVLVVAADDGVMPQTVEAIRHAQTASVPILVAINKMDRPDADPDRVKRQLAEYALVGEEWGGETVQVPISAKEGTGIDRLLEMILLVADIKDLRANPSRTARGTVIEAKIDRGRGPVATVLVQNGTLHVGDAFLVGQTTGRVRALIDDKGKTVKSAPPSTPVEVLGLVEVPAAGDAFLVVADERKAREVAQQRSTRARDTVMRERHTTPQEAMLRIGVSEGPSLNLVLKGDVQGSVEALRSALERLSSEVVQVKVLHDAVGAVNESDVMLAATAGATVIGFNVRPDSGARREAEEHGVTIRLHQVIYEAIDDVNAMMRGLLKPVFHETVLGRAEVRQVFRVPKVGTVAGLMVLDGKVSRNAKVRLLRDGSVVFDGSVDSLKRFKDDAREVAAGMECGMGLERFNDIKLGDVVEAYMVEEVKAG